MPAIATEPVALLASEQPLGRVMVTTLLDLEPVAPALQPEKLPAKVTEGEAGMPPAKAGSKVTVTVSPAARAPLEEAVNCSVQVASRPVWEWLGVKVTDDGDVAWTVTVGCAAMLVRVPLEVDLCCVVKALLP